MANHLYTLHRTPFALAPLLHKFFEASERRERGILLGYLVLPLVLYKPSRDYLKRIKDDSSLRSMCSKQRRLIGLESRLQDFKQLTNDSMMILMAEGRLRLDDQLAPICRGELRTDNADPDLMKACSNLAELFINLEVVTIYRMLGLKEL